MNKERNDKMLKVHLQMCRQEQRLATFTSWPFGGNKKCNPSKMAEAGFVYHGSEGEEDLVKCFLCEKPLDGWEEDDDPWEEHVSHSSSCSYAKLRCPMSQLKLSEYLNIKDEVYTLVINKAHDEEIETVKARMAVLKKALKKLRK